MRTETFTLRSIDVGGIGTLKEAHTASGGRNISPALSWVNAPEGTRSFAVTMYDKDAPTGGGFWHWLIFDIPPTVNGLPADAGNISSHLAPPSAIQSITDYGSYGYGGPNPPHGHGWHSYMITVYALKVESLGMTRDMTPAQVGFNLWKNTIEKASIVFYYQN